MKPQVQSKTTWFNILALAATVITSEQFGALLPAATPFIAVSAPLVNMLLRQFTSEPLKPLF